LAFVLTGFLMELRVMSTVPQNPHSTKKWTWVDFAFIAMTLGSLLGLAYTVTRK
jgi:hypothetical protein